MDGGVLYGTQKVITIWSLRSTYADGGGGVGAMHRFRFCVGRRQPVADGSAGGSVVVYDPTARSPHHHRRSSRCDHYYPIGPPAIIQYSVAAAINTVPVRCRRDNGQQYVAHCLVCAAAGNL